MAGYQMIKIKVWNHREWGDAMYMSHFVSPEIEPKGSPFSGWAGKYVCEVSRRGDTDTIKMLGLVYYEV